MTTRMLIEIDLAGPGPQYISEGGFLHLTSFDHSTTWWIKLADIRAVTVTNLNVVIDLPENVTYLLRGDTAARERVANLWASHGGSPRG